MNIDSKEKAIEILSNIKSPSYLRIEALFTLMNIADQQSLNALFECMRHDPCELVRHEAAFCLGETASDEAVKVLKECYENDNSLVVKHECLMSLGTLGKKEDLEFAKDKTSHENYEVKCSAQVAVDRLQQQDDFEDVKTHSKDYIEKLFDYKNFSQNDRIQILFKLMTIDSDEAIDAIYNSLLKDPCRVVRHEAAFCLGEFQNKKATNLLIDAIKKEPTSMVIHEGLFALGTTGDKDTLPFIQSYLDHKDYIVSESARIAIDRINLLKTPYSGKAEFENIN